ncbi:MAG: hypothetical protein SFX19_06610 [Alphaproteobacteria bacterium]|nr:hypothetical protein [Alphaproteobacteria bacterium]
MSDREITTAPLQRIARGGGGGIKLRVFGPPKNHYDQPDDVIGSTVPFIIEIAAPLPEFSRVAGAILAAGLGIGNAHGSFDYVGPGTKNPTLGVSGQSSRMRDALAAMQCDDVEYVEIPLDIYKNPGSTLDTIKEHMVKNPIESRYTGRQ